MNVKALGDANRKNVQVKRDLFLEESLYSGRNLVS